MERREPRGRYSPEVRARVVRLVLEHSGEYDPQWEAMVSISGKIGCTADTLRRWVRQAERDEGLRPGPTSSEQVRIWELEHEVRELRQANEILRKASAYFAQAELDRRFKPGSPLLVPDLIREHREAYGVEPICRVLPIALSTYHDHVAKRRDPARRSARAQRDAALKVVVQWVFEENFRVYGVRKVGRQLHREGFEVARCTVSRLMRALGLQGVIGGKPVRTTVSNKTVPCPFARVSRQFHAAGPNSLWVSDFTYVATWADFVYVAFVIDAFARRIVGWRVSRTAHAGFVLDALEQALHDPRSLCGGGLVHHSAQYVSIKFTERLVEAGIEPSPGSVGDSYDNALAETINGLYKAEVIHRRGPWRGFEAVEMATPEWVDWLDNRRLLEPIGNMPPAEAEARYYDQSSEFARVA